MLKRIPLLLLLTSFYSNAEAEKSTELKSKTTTESTQGTNTSEESPLASASSNKTATSASSSQDEEIEEVDEKAIEALLNEDVKEETDEKSPITGAIEFGYQSHSGNTDEQSLNSRIALSYITGQIRYSAEWRVYMEDEDGEEDKRMQRYQLQGDYKLSPKTYLYSTFEGMDSKYSSYFRDYTFSAGMGYQLINTDDLSAEMELGPGYRIQEPNTDEIDDDDPIIPEDVNEYIIRTSLSSKWTPLKTLTLEAELTVITGDSNTRVDTDISATNDITDSIALKISHSRQHLSRVPDGLDKQDSVLNVNIVFSFK